MAYNRLERLARLFASINGRTQQIDDQIHLAQNTLVEQFLPVDERHSVSDTVEVDYFDPTQMKWGYNENPIPLQRFLDTQADWQAGLYTTHLDVMTIPGSIILKRPQITFTRPSTALNPDTGSSVSSGNPRYVYGRWTNVLTDNQASVETDISGFTQAGATAVLTRTDEEHAFGKYSLRVTTGDEIGHGVRTPIGQTIVRAGKTYTGSFYLRGKFGAEKLVFQLQFFDINDTFLNAVTVRPTVYPAWNRVSATMVAPNEAYSVSIRLVNDMPISQTFYIDGLMLNEGGLADFQIDSRSLMVEDTVTNVLPVGSENFTTGWSMFSGSSVTVTPGQKDPFGGTGAFRIQSTGGTSVLKYYVSTPLTSQIGFKYPTSVWVRVRSATNAIVLQNAGAVSTTISKSQGWVLAKVENAPGNGTANVQLQFRVPLVADNLDIDAYWPQVTENVTRGWVSTYTTPGTTKSRETIKVDGPIVKQSGGNIRTWVRSIAKWNSAYSTTAFPILTVSGQDNAAIEQATFEVTKDDVTNSIRAVFRNFNNSIAATLSYSVAGRNDDNWLHLSFTWTADRIAMFVDGALVAESFVTWNMSPTINWMYVGSNITGTTSWGASFDDTHTETEPADDSEITTRYMRLAFEKSTAFTSSLLRFDNTILSDFPDTATWESATIDTGIPVNINATGYLTYDGVSGTAAYIAETATSDDGMTFDPWEPASPVYDTPPPIDEGDIGVLPDPDAPPAGLPFKFKITSTPRRYWKVRITLATTDQTRSPELRIFILETGTRTLQIATNWLWGLGGRWQT